LRSPLASVSGLRQYRIVHERGALLIEVVTADPEAPAAVAHAVSGALEKSGAGDVAVTVRRVEAIERHAASGKFKLIESR
jgi:hypothetical protein